MLAASPANAGCPLDFGADAAAVAVPAAAASGPSWFLMLLDWGQGRSLLLALEGRQLLGMRTHPQRQPQQQQQQYALQEAQQVGIEKRQDKAQYREQAALIQAQAQEIGELRRALARVTQDRHSTGVDYADVLKKKDLQLATLYNIAADASRERGVLRQTVAELEADLQVQKQQLFAIVDTLAQIKDGLKPGELAELQLDQWTYTAGEGSTLATDDDLVTQLHQMHNLGQALMEDALRDEQVLLRSTQDDLDSMNSRFNSTNSLASSNGNGNGNVFPGTNGTGNGTLRSQGQMGRFSHYYTGM